MEALQVHYTSCRYGTLGQAGFQVRAESKGIDPSDRNEIIKHSSYRRPLTDQEPMTSDLPIACRFYRLPSGRLAMTRVNYTGTDYSGRSGNFFAHTLVLPAEALDRGPAEYFFWNGWKQNLAPGEDEAPPQPLPTLPLAEISGAPSFQPADITAFLRQGGGRYERLETMVHALFLTQTSSRTVVIRSYTQDALEWITALYHCFPPGITTGFEFSTYEYSLVGLPLIAATVVGTEITCDQAQRDYQFYVFDEQGDADSLLPDDPRDEALAYARVVVHLLIHSPEQLCELFELAAQFGCSTLDVSLCRVAQIYSLALPELSGFVDPDRLVTLAEFTLDHPQAPPWEQITEFLGGPLCRLTEDGEASAYLVYIRFLVRGAQEQKSAEHARRAIASWQALFMVGLAAGALPPELETARQVIATTVKDSERAIATNVLNHFGELTKLIPQGSAETVRQVLMAVEGALKTLKHEPVLDQKEMMDLVKVMASNKQALHTFLPELLQQTDDTKVFLRLCDAAGAFEKSIAAPQALEFGQLFAKVFATTEADFALEVRKRLPGAVVVAEWDIVTQSGGADAFLFHRNGIIDYLNNINWSDYGQQLVIPWLRRWLDDSDVLKPIARDLLPREDFRHLDTDLAQRCLELLNSTVSLDPNVRADSELHSNLYNMARDLKFKLQPNRVALLWTINKASDPTQPYPFKALEDAKSDLKLLSKEDQALVVHLLLDGISPRRLLKVEHGKLINALQPLENRAFLRTYRPWLKSTLTELSTENLISFVFIWLQRDKRTREGKALSALAHHVMPILARAIARDKKAEKKLEQRFKDLNKSSSGPVVQDYKQLNEEIRKDKMGIIGRLKRFFIRGILG